MPEYKLHEAVKNNNIDLVKSLVEKGHDVNELNERGEIPLHSALQVK